MDASGDRSFRLAPLLYAILLIAFVAVLYRNEEQLRNIAVVLGEGTWYLIGISIVGVLLVLANQAALYASLYELFLLPTVNVRMLTLYLMTRFVAVAAPAAGLSGVAPFIHDARKRDLAMGRVIVANLLYVVLWYSSFAIFLFIGLAELYFSKDLLWQEVVAASVLLSINATLVIGLGLGALYPATLDRVLQTLSRGIGRIFIFFRRQPPFTQATAHQFVTDLTQALNQIRVVGWRKLWRPAAHGIVNELLTVGILWLVSSAFGITLSYGQLIAAYSVSILFLIISPTPGGLGFVEGLVILTLTSFGVRRDAALVITLAYRGVTFWLPFFLGFGVTVAQRLHRVQRRRNRNRS